MISTNRAARLSFFKTSYPWIIVCCGMLFYCFNYFLRVSPGVMQHELTHAFHMSAYEFGALAAFYYYAYTPMQLPAGMIYDKYGVRVVLSTACLVAVTGLSIFIVADNFYMAAAGRFMIGLGAAFSYIGSLKLASIWLPANRFATVAGLSTSLGMLSGALSQKYLTVALETIGYQQALKVAMMIGFALSIFILLVIRNKPLEENAGDAEAKSAINLKQLGSALRILACNRQMWLIGIIGCLLYLPSSVFLDLWGIPYLKTVYHVTGAQAVAISSATFYGWIISGPILGSLSDKIKRRRVFLIWSGIFAGSLLSLVFYLPGGVNPDWLTSIFFLIGFSCGSHPLCFVLGKENNPIQIAGTAVALTNMLIMSGGAIFQPIVGKLLDMHTSGALTVDGYSIYTSADYTFALSLVPMGVAVGIVLSIFLKETYCESQAKAEDEKLFEQQDAPAPASMIDSDLEPEFATETDSMSS